MSRVFISYRRGDSKWAAKALYNHLSEHFGEEQIFMDIDTIEPGVDFVRAIEDAVGSCGALVAVIGTRWLHITDEQGRRRLGDPNDFVRLEIAHALMRDIRVIPVLIDGTSMPHSEDLPPDLAMLARRNALEISEKRFKHDADQLIDALEQVIGRPDATGSPTPFVSPVQEPTLSFGGESYVTVEGLPGEKIFWQEGGWYYVDDQILNNTPVWIILTTQRFLVLPLKKPTYISGILLRPKKVFEYLPLVVRHTDVMRVEDIKPLFSIATPTVEVAVGDGTRYQLSIVNKHKQRVQQLREVISKG